MITAIKKLFNRPKRERGVSRLQEIMLRHAFTADHGHYIPWLHTPWFHQFNLTAKPVSRLVEDGYLVQDRYAGWYSLTLKGKQHLRNILENQAGNANVQFVTQEQIDWHHYLMKLRQTDYVVSIENADDFVPVKVAP